MSFNPTFLFDSLKLISILMKSRGFQGGYFVGLMGYVYNPKVRLVGEILGTKFDFKVLSLLTIDNFCIKE